MNVLDIAKVVHELNKAYCECIGDNSQPSWEDAPEWLKKGTINGVIVHLENPDISPSATHDNWLKEKIKEGWKYGQTKNPVTKEHPCCILYEYLPTEHRAKDYIFKQAIDSLKDFLTT